MSARSLRFRMMLLFCTVAGALLAVSYFGFYGLFSRQMRAQLDKRILDTCRPVVADLISDPTEQDVNQLNVPGEFFELLDSSGRVVQKSVNLKGQPLDLGSASSQVLQPVFRTVNDPTHGRLRVGMVPFQRGGENTVLVLAMPTEEIERVLGDVRRMIYVLLPLSLLLAAAVSSWYVGRSLRPVAELTRRAADMTERIADPARREPWTPLAVRNPRDELGQLAETFNRLFERMDSALGQLRQFVTDASHELRTPLSVLQGETELLLAESHREAEYRNALEVIHGELKQLSRIVESLFTLAMADAGQLRLPRQPLYLNEVLEEACARAVPLASAREISIERDLNAEVAAEGDETSLRQLFLIFLDNAIKYSSPRTRIKVSLETANGSARVRFEDQGMGISEEQRVHIFERFFRGQTSEGEDTQSGGLGLAIAQAIVRAQDGAIECESKPGSGTTFVVTLPLHPSNGSDPIHG